MKKFISLMIVAVLLVSALYVSAFAADIKVEGGTSHDVYAKYVEGNKTDNYKVIISWGDMNFTYSSQHESWNTETHQWDKDGGGWSVDTENGNQITIANHSSKDVTATFKFDATADGVTGAFSGENIKNNAVTVGDALGGSAQTETVFFMPDGTLTKTEANSAGFVSVGNITVTLN